jgi:hypothetical protein
MVDLKNRNTPHVKFRNQHWISIDLGGNSTQHKSYITAKFAAERETVLKFEPDIYYPVKIRPNGKLKLEGSNATIDVLESNGNAISTSADVFIGSSLIDELCKEFVELYLKVKTYDYDLTVLQNNVNNEAFTTNTRGGSKTMRQRKQRQIKERQIKERQRKQKSKRKKTNS